MTLLVVIRIIQWIAASLSIGGFALSVYVIRDARKDLALSLHDAISPSERRANEDSTDTVTSAAMSSLIAHFLLLSLAVIGLTTSPQPARYGFTIWFASVYVLIQASMVAFQIRVTMKRHALHNMGSHV
jgi:hypothetical protein